MSAAAEPAPLAVSSCVHPARPWVPGLSGFSGPQNTPQPPCSPVSPPRTGALGQRVGALLHAAGGCGAWPEGAREPLCPPSAPFPRFGLSLSVVLAVVRSCSSSFVSRGCRPGALGGQAPAVTRVQCVNPLPGTGDCSLVRALCLAQLTGVARKRTRSLVWCTVSVTATQRTLPGRAASRAVLEVPQSYIDLQTLKAAGLRVWLTNRRNLGAEILPLGTVTDRCWHILNYWKLLKNNRLLEKHKGLRDARAGAGASGQAALPRGPPCPPAGGHPALPCEATPPALGSLAASATVRKQQRNRGVCSK